jgi:hypothetical protein
MCDGCRVEANHQGACDSRSRLTAWLATGVPCAQPGRDLDMKTLFRRGGASRRRTGCCAGLSPPWLGRRLRRHRRLRRGEERRGEGRRGSAGGGGSRRTLGFCSADSSPSSPFASAGGVWSAVALRPTYAPNLRSNVRQRRLPC